MWQEKDQELYQEFSFKDFNEAFNFIKLVAEEAEKQNHHPRWSQDWNKVQIWLSTHDKGNQITNKDHLLAKSIDTLYGNNQKNIPKAKKTSKFTELKLYTDGGSRGNPGPSASAFVIFDKHNDIVASEGVYLGITTNNQAEYQALKLGLQETIRLGASKLSVYMDSLLIVNQITGKYKVRDNKLRPIYLDIMGIIKSFSNISFSHIPRELNKLADALVNKALDQHLDEVN